MEPKTFVWVLRQYICGMPARFGSCIWPYVPANLTPIPTSLAEARAGAEEFSSPAAARARMKETGLDGKKMSNGWVVLRRTKKS
jgi:hypothetical protein